jgi:hypothetical protein
MNERGFRVAQAAALAALLGWAPAVRAQSDSYGTSLYGSGQNWSATAARTVGRGANVLGVEAGWPGIEFTYQHGIDDLTDFGVRVSLLYSFEGTTDTTTGLQLQAPYRRMLTNGESTNVAFHVDPGLSIYSSSGSNGTTLVGVGGTIGILAGWQVSPRTTLDLGADFPILFAFTNRTGVMFGPMLGGGAEYEINGNLHMTIRLRIGPEFALANNQTTSQFAFTSLVGLAYNAR